MSSVKYMHSGMQNAPQLTNDWGVLVDMLDACLVNGFNTQTINGLSRSGTTATATFGSGHGYIQNQIIQIAGVVETGWNGQYRVLSVTANTLIFAVSASVAATASGSMTAKTAPLGFEKPFSGTQKAVYRSPNLESTRMYLRVDNSLDPAWTSSYAKFAKVTISDGMSDVDTFTGSQAPYDPDNPNKNHVGSGSGTSAINGWAKWYYARYAGQADYISPNNGSRKWVVIGDDKGFYLSTAWASDRPNYRALYAFGDLHSAIDGDAYHCLLQSTLSYSAADQEALLEYQNSELLQSNKSCAVLLKPASGIGGPAYAGGRSLMLSNNGAISGFQAAPQIDVPNPSNNASLFAQTYIVETNNLNGYYATAVRGALRGAYWCLMRKPYDDMQMIDVDGLGSCVSIEYNNNSAGYSGMVLIGLDTGWA